MWDEASAAQTIATNAQTIATNAQTTATNAQSYAETVAGRIPTVVDTVQAGNYNPVTSNAVAGMFGIRQISITLATGFGGNIYCYKLNNIVFFTAMEFYSDHQVSSFEHCAFNFPWALQISYFWAQSRTNFLSMLLNITGRDMILDYGCSEYFGINNLNWFSSMYISVE